MSINILEKELQFYKKRVEELSSENIHLDLRVSTMTQELNQRKKAFELLSNLQTSVGSNVDLENILEIVFRQVNSTIGMDRTCFLIRAQNRVFKPMKWLGYTEDESEKLKLNTIDINQELLNSKSGFFLTKKLYQAKFLNK